MKGAATYLEKIFALQITDKEFVARIFLNVYNSRRKSNSIDEWAKDKLAIHREGNLVSKSEDALFDE